MIFLKFSDTRLALHHPRVAINRWFDQTGSREKDTPTKTAHFYLVPQALEQKEY